MERQEKTSDRTGNKTDGMTEKVPNRTGRGVTELERGAR